MKLYVPIYSVTLLLSAVLLFTVQPMFSKMVLPLLGGTSQVWTTAMLFFQLCLLGGYAYAHGTTRYLSIKYQAILHLVLLAIFVVVLPFAIPDGWTPPENKNPTFWQLSLMAITVGGPFFVVSGCAPMLQRWFSVTPHKDAHDPYFLYGASNLGSMSALLAYPVVIEPLLSLSKQTQFWMYGYVILIASIFVCFLLIWNKSNTQALKAATNQANDNASPITSSLRLKWITLAFIPSSLMLGVTTFVTTDIASVPLLWVIPLALYIGTFILVFARKPLFRPEHLTLTSGLGVIALVMVMILIKEMYLYPALLVSIHMLVFFIVALTCHTDLARSRPSAQHLTEFYLIMSFGGALGGIFNAIIAPNAFVLPVEYAIALGLAMFMRYANDSTQNISALKIYWKENGVTSLIKNNAVLSYLAILLAIPALLIADNQELVLMLAAAIVILLLFLLRTRWGFAVAIAPILLISPISLPLTFLMSTDTLHQSRNFYGILKIIETEDERLLLHGTTNHGAQPVKEEFKLQRLSYYTENSPFTDPFTLIETKAGPQKIGIIGLGVGVMACYTHPERHFDFFEIDKDVADIAENTEYFTYLSDCGSEYEIILGDGRLKIDEKPDGYYDLITIDAFSSDNIPVHLLTKEAVQLYLDKIKPDGVVAFHISNNYIDLEPVLAKIGESLGMTAYARLTNASPVGNTGIDSYPAHMAALTRNKDYMAMLEEIGWTKAMTRENVSLWTDQFSNIVTVLRNYSMQARFKMLDEQAKEKQETEQ